MTARSSDGFRPGRPFRAAYAVALGASLVSSWLTTVYVGAGAVELNPVVRWLIDTLGFGGMVVARGLVLVAAYWGYLALGLLGARRRLVVGFAWLGAAVHVLDAAHDLREAVTAGWLPAIEPLAVTAPVLVAALLGGLLRPRLAGPDAAGG
jgi:hypothetical protein